MIVEMLKYSFLLYHKSYPEFVKLLKKEGVLHILEKNELSDEIRDKLSYIKEIEKAIKLVADNELEPNTNATAEPLGGAELVKLIFELNEKLEANKQNLELLSKEQQQLEAWGSFSAEKIKGLEAHGIHLSFFSCKAAAFDPQWEEQHNLQLINEVSSYSYFVILHDNSQELELDAEYIKFPDYSAAELQTQIAELETANQALNQDLAQLGLHAQQLESYKEAKISEVNEHKLYLNTDNVADEKVKIVEGWVPTNKVASLNQSLEAEDIAYLSEEPTAEDEVPIKLKNNKFNKLFEPIGELYTLPNYKELDLTALFAPFFLLFFGFCLGDAGYGVVILLGATLFKGKVDKQLRPMLTLAQLLGLSTVIFGTLTGTLFGVEMAKVEALAAYKEKFLTADDLFSLAIVIGVIQILFGMIVNVVNVTKQQGFKYSLAGIGWFIMFSGLVSLYGLSTLVPPVFPALAEIPTVVYSWLIVSGVLILFLNNPDKNLAVNFGAGLWDAYNMATGFLGDLLSYIRLFALGLSSGILGLVFNSLAMDMSGDTPVVSQLIFVVILLVGHGINIFMAALGSFVHPLRLTFVEFYKNAGFAGGGKAYSPFK